MTIAGKLPPHNLEAEQSVLGALMIDKEAILRVADILRPLDFYRPSHGKIYEAIMTLYEKSQPIDTLTVSAMLKEMNVFKDVGGSTYLADVMNMVPSAANVEHYANLVKEKRVLRDLISASAEIAESALNPDGDIDTMLDTIENKIFSIAQHSRPQKFVSLNAELKGAYERIEKLHQSKGELRGVSTGFTELDNYLSGFQNSNLIVLGARPSFGKTSLALDFARHAATKGKKCVGIFSLEMSREEVIDRLIAAEARVSLWKLRTGKLTEDVDFQLIQSALDSLSNTKIFVDDTPGINVLQIRSVARRLQMEHGLDLLVVDYLQLITPRNTRTDNTVAQITEISRGLKILARELNVPVIALSQLSRGIEQREDKVPKLADLRESGSIEQDSDVVMLIYRKDKHKQNPDPEEINSAEIIVAKHRNGPIGSIKLKFDPDRASFTSIDMHHLPPTTV